MKPQFMLPPEFFESVRRASVLPAEAIKSLHTALPAITPALLADLGGLSALPDGINRQVAEALTQAQTSMARVLAPLIDSIQRWLNTPSVERDLLLAFPFVEDDGFTPERQQALQDLSGRIAWHVFSHEVYRAIRERAETAGMTFKSVKREELERALMETFVYAVQPQYVRAGRSWFTNNKGRKTEIIPLKDLPSDLGGEQVGYRFWDWVHDKSIRLAQDTLVQRVSGDRSQSFDPAWLEREAAEEDTVDEDEIDEAISQAFLQERLEMIREKLSSREFDVMLRWSKLECKHGALTAIAHEMGVKPSTVRNHKMHATEKLKNL